MKTSFFLVITVSLVLVGCVCFLNSQLMKQDEILYQIGEIRFRQFQQLAKEEGAFRYCYTFQGTKVYSEFIEEGEFDRFHKSFDLCEYDEFYQLGGWICHTNYNFWGMGPRCKYYNDLNEMFRQ